MIHGCGFFELVDSFPVHFGKFVWDFKMSPSLITYPRNWPSFQPIFFIGVPRYAPITVSIFSIRDDPHQLEFWL